MDEKTKEQTELRSMMRGVIEEFVQVERAKAEPAYKAELLDERKRREDLERRVNELVQENHASRQIAEEAERSASVRAESATAGRSQSRPGLPRGEGRYRARLTTDG